MSTTADHHKIQFLGLLLALIAALLMGCGGQQSQEAPPIQKPTATETAEPFRTTDFAALPELDPAGNTARAEATVKSFVDGDTVHFHVSADVDPSGVLKARFLAIDTPESTGKIEEYGKQASDFTKNMLSQAESILLESESDRWMPDSTGDRFLVWVWYRMPDEDRYRNLNVEILQNGLAKPNSTASSRYGDIAVQALEQAKAQKLKLYSGQPDPEYFYGDAIELTLGELRCNITDYVGKKVAFNGIITTNSGTQGVYVEDYDAQSDMYHGIYIYYGHSLNGTGLDILTVGNEVRIVGSVQYYEAGGSYQISDISYRMMKPEDPGNIQKISQGHAPSYRPVTADTLVNGVFTDADGRIMPWHEAAMATSVEIAELTVEKVISGNDASTLICRRDETEISVRVVGVPDCGAYLNQRITVKGLVDSFDGSCQIRVFTQDNISIIN